MRARPHQRHLATQNIEELRQLVQAEAAQKKPDWRDARVVTQLVQFAPFGARLRILRQVMLEDIR